MAKLTNNRYYFDFNATSPLASSVKDWLSSGDFSFANPASFHFSGKKSKRLIQSTSDYLYDCFGFNEQEYDLFYHSGATEAISNLTLGTAVKRVCDQSPYLFLYSGTDHSAIRRLAPLLQRMGNQIQKIEVDQRGLPHLEDLEARVQSFDGPVFCHWTWVNNETGIIWPLSWIKEIKERNQNLQVHVDAVQAPGKIKDWQILDDSLDAYSFSAHKFGALKGVGFSFTRCDFSYESILPGGGQQRGKRGGTQNPDGIRSIKLALESLLEIFDFDRVNDAKSLLESEMESVLGERGIIITPGNDELRNCNTSCLLIPGKKANQMLTAFDIANIDLSSGSACSSGSVDPSSVLLTMGYSEEDAKSGLRFSLGPCCDVKAMEEVLPQIKKILSRF